MDLYFIVAELELPAGLAATWRAAPIPPTKRYPDGTTLDFVLENAEGPVHLDVSGERVSLRAFLIDSAYFVIREELEAALAQAVTLGARGCWYSGDHVAGEWVVAGQRPVRARVPDLPSDVQGWIRDAHELDTPLPDTRKKAAPSRRAKPKARPRAKAKARPKAKAKPRAKTKAKPKSRSKRRPR